MLSLVSVSGNVTSKKVKAGERSVKIWRDFGKVKPLRLAVILRDMEVRLGAALITAFK